MSLRYGMPLTSRRMSPAARPDFWAGLPVHHQGDLEAAVGRLVHLDAQPAAALELLDQGDQAGGGGDVAGGWSPANDGAATAASRRQGEGNGTRRASSIFIGIFIGSCSSRPRNRRGRRSRSTAPRAAGGPARRGCAGLPRRATGWRSPADPRRSARAGKAAWEPPAPRRFGAPASAGRPRGRRARSARRGVAGRPHADLAARAAGSEQQQEKRPADQRAPGCLPPDSVLSYAGDSPEFCCNSGPFASYGRALEGVQNACKNGVRRS